MRYDIFFKNGEYEETETLNAAWQAIADELSGVACAENDHAPSFAFVGEEKVAVIIDLESEYSREYYSVVVDFDGAMRAYEKHIEARCA